MKRANVFKLSMLILIVLGWWSLAGAEGFPVKDLPFEAKSLADFIPKGWAVQDQVSGDLNGDGTPDIAAILIQSKSDGAQKEDEDELQRAFIVLLGREGEKLSLAGSNDNIILCKGCGGVKESVEIKIQKGVLVVDQMSGSRESSDEKWRFRFDSQAKRFVLIGRDLESGDSAQGKGTIESSNYLTGKKITSSYRYDKSGERKIISGTKEGEIPRQTTFMEDVKPEEGR